MSPRDDDQPISAVALAFLDADILRAGFNERRSAATAAAGSKSFSAIVYILIGARAAATAAATVVASAAAAARPSGQKAVTYRANLAIVICARSTDRQRAA